MKKEEYEEVKGGVDEEERKRRETKRGWERRGEVG